jgi:hypothetical protein
VREGAGATLEVGFQHVSIQIVNEQDIHVRGEIRERWGIGDLVCNAFPALGVQEGSHRQYPIGKLFGLGEGRERGTRGL